ncbi:MAG: NAD(P)-dependent dehydrogenase (short-subunit alcohol dehydrogenase family), partial [Candidatus Azotimanducaceae bacterium]
THGSIVNIASVAAKRPLLGAADYCVSKAGVAMLTQVMAAELSQLNVRVNAIGPGFIETPMTQNIRAENEGNMMVMSMTPMGRYGLPIEIANTALFLLSDESSYFSGQTLFPAGGMFTG